MQSESQIAGVARTQRTYARLAGFLYLAVIMVALGSGVILSRVAGNGNFVETGRRIAASERLYRVALSAAVIVSLGSAVLAFSLNATLHAVDSFLAQLAMIFSLADSFLALVVRMCSFVRLHLYLSVQPDAAGIATAQAFGDLVRTVASTTENLGGICFGIGSLLFVYLFFKSSYIPRALSVLGVLAALIWVVLYFASLIFPEHHALFQRICFPPMLLADVLTGLYLLSFAVKTSVPHQPAQPAPLSVQQA